MKGVYWYTLLGKKIHEKILFFKKEVAVLAHSMSPSEGVMNESRLSQLPFSFACSLGLQSPSHGAIYV